MNLVLDASMALAWLFEDEATETAYGVLERVSDGGAVVPALWHLETANALHTAARRGRCDTGFVDGSLASLAQLPIAVDEATCARAWSDTLALARSDGLTLYDAAYLELAQRRGLPLASCDRALVEAARRHRLSVIHLGD